MAVNSSRSQNVEFQEGATDGTYKKMPMDRSNVAFPSNPSVERKEMSWRYGFEEAPVEYLPDDLTPARHDPGNRG